MLRPAGFGLAALLAAVLSAAAQVPGVAPGNQPPGGGAAAPAADPKLDPHLLGWEQRMVASKNFRADVTLTRKEAVFNKSRKYSGAVLCAKPNYAILRLENTEKAQPGQPVDYEAYVSTGDAIYEYSGLQKTVTKYKLNPGAAGDNLMLDFLSGMKADTAKRRFQMNLFNEDANYVYIDIKPVSQKDQLEFSHVRFAMYGPRVQQFSYLPAQVWLQKPNGDTEMWDFTKPQLNVDGIVPEKTFIYQKVVENGKEWPLKEFQPPQPPPAGKLPGKP